MFARYKTSISAVIAIFVVLPWLSRVVALDLRPTTSPFIQTGTDVSLRVQGNVCIGTSTPVDALSLCTSPVADATRGLLNLSNTPLSGGSASGTFISGNPLACAGDFLNLQLADAARAKLTCAGALTVVSSTNNLSIFAATTSAQLAGVLSDETGTGLAVFSIAPVFTSINNNLSIFAATTSAQLAGVISDETGSDLLVFSTSPSLTTPNIGAATATSINFGTTTLSRYTEGTFTSAFAFGGACTGCTYGAQVGSYTYIGNRLLFTLFVSLTNKGSSTGTATITGLPVAVHSGTSQHTAFSLYCSDFSATITTQMLMAETDAGGSIINLYYLTGGIATVITDAMFGNTTNCIINGSYRTL